MAHADQLEFVRLVKRGLPQFFTKVDVLEIGSLDINGSVRSEFLSANYIGVDVGVGPGVDLVGEGQLLDFSTGSFDVVISCECLEHNPFWVETVSNMFRMVRPGGLVIVSCATTGRPEHGTTATSSYDSPLTIGIGWDYYKNVSRSDFEKAFALDAWCDEFILIINWSVSDLYFVGIKKGNGSVNINSLGEELKTRFGKPKGLKAYSVYLAAQLAGDPGVKGIRFIWTKIQMARNYLFK